MRPFEADRFWDPKLKLGWKSINLVDEKPYIYIDKRVIQKRGLSARKILIRKGFLDMLKVFKAEGEERYPMRVRNWRRIYSDLRKKIFGDRLTISRNKDEAKDIARHTFASNLYQYEKNIAQVSAETGDTEKTLNRHYINPLISEADAKNFFEEIDARSLKKDLKIQLDDDGDPLDNIPFEILTDPEFIRAYSGGKFLYDPSKLTTEQTIETLRSLRNELLHAINKRRETSTDI